MRLWRIATAARPLPFGEAVGDSFVFDGTLAAHQQALCRGAGLELFDVAADGPLQVGPGLVLFDDVFVDAPALADFRHRAGTGDTWALGLGDDALGRHLTPLGQLPTLGDSGAAAVGLHALATPVAASSVAELRRALAAASRTVLLPPAGSEQERLPGFPQRRPTLAIPRATAIAGRIRHWVHILWLNQALAYARAQRTAVDRRGNCVAPTARIHPTAYVERSSVGAGTVIEPHCTVIDSRLGTSCHVADHTVLIGCALGSGCQTLTDSYLRRVVSYPESTISSMGCEELLVGRRVFVTAAAIFFATTRGEDAAVDDDGHPVATGRPRLGGCIGHRAVLGARAIFAPGMALPNDSLVVMRPEEGVGRIEADVGSGSPACWHAGALVPVERVAPGHRPPEID